MFHRTARAPPGIVNSSYRLTVDLRRSDKGGKSRVANAYRFVAGVRMLQQLATRPLSTSKQPRRFQDSSRISISLFQHLPLSIIFLLRSRNDTLLLREQPAAGWGSRCKNRKRAKNRGKRRAERNGNRDLADFVRSSRETRP